MSDLIERLARINAPLLYGELARPLEEADAPLLAAARASSLGRARQLVEAVVDAMRESEAATDFAEKLGVDPDDLFDAFLREHGLKEDYEWA